MKTACLASVLALAGVSTVGGKAQQTVEPAPEIDSPRQNPGSIAADVPPHANLFIYRSYAEPTAWAATVKIDDRKLAAVGNKRWTAVKLAPGTYTVTTGWSFLSAQSGEHYQLTVEAGKTHILEITGSSQFTGASDAALQFQMGSGIAEVSGENALGRVAQCCRFKEPAF